jgi:cytochrome b involved in lipid metabolism
MNYTNNKGFAPILVFLIISAIFLGGGGIYEYKKIKSESKKENNDKNALITNTDLEVDVKKSNEQPASIRTTTSTSVNKIEDGKNDDDNEENEIEDDDDDAKTPSSTLQNTPTPNVNQVQPKPTISSYTMAEVKIHATAQNCWTTINGSVYNVTSWINQHPGGSAAIISLCGIDGTSAFSGQHGSQARPVSELASFKIGVLSN